MKRSRWGWRIATVGCPILAIIIIQQTVSSGMTTAFEGKPINVIAYIGGLLAAFVLVCFAVYAGVRSRQR